MQPFCATRPDFVSTSPYRALLLDTEALLLLLLVEALGLSGAEAGHMNGPPIALDFGGRDSFVAPLRRPGAAALLRVRRQTIRTEVCAKGV